MLSFPHHGLEIPKYRLCLLKVTIVPVQKDFEQIESL